MSTPDRMLFINRSFLRTPSRVIVWIATIRDLTSQLSRLPFKNNLPAAYLQYLDGEFKKDSDAAVKTK